MTTYYEDSKLKGENYQDFLVSQLLLRGIIIMPFTSKKYQYNVGESASRHEMKFDDRLKETGNLYIELYEKTNENNPTWIPSGINRQDNTLFYIIGDYTQCFIFTKSSLKTLHAGGSLRPVSNKTSQGVLVPISVAIKFAEQIKF